MSKNTRIRKGRGKKKKKKTAQRLKRREKSVALK